MDCIVLKWLESLSTVLFPKFLSSVSKFAERLLITKEFRFFFKLLEDVLKDRRQSKEVLSYFFITDKRLLCKAYEISCRLLLMKKFHDFIELADEAISDFTKEVDGETVPMWSREEIDEIIMAQVLYRTYFGFIDGIDWCVFVLRMAFYNYQSTLFMLAGFDTTATTLTNTCFQLAKNPDIQEKLYDSIIAQMANYVSTKLN